ncbi:DsbA family protein [Pseudonocardia bannensis]|uniref:Thioredoxin domain-containing protein n=1 Tax=Pseudonocardia bannensis TaxID=630973 RepID=A0A848DRN6_9PSEU|nr:thioredoxin domain-containing protein [Pseudonocardia bannensis]NMH95398.1 thioredoxin domain-containing protein [Pseudonocardia bannensis]
MSANRAAGRRKQKAALGGRRGPSSWAIVAVVVVVLFAGAVGFGVYRAGQGGEDVLIPAGATATGVPIGQPAARATIDLYVDFQCPACKTYEEQVGPVIDELVAAGSAKVIYHPVAFLDRFSTTQYSTRSSAASGCAQDAGVFTAYTKLLFANQPPENTPGLPDEQLIALGRQAGAGEGFATCVTDQRYVPWTGSVTEDASRSGVTATPTVKVNGQEIERTVQALRQAVQAA